MILPFQETDRMVGKTVGPRSFDSIASMARIRTSQVTQRESLDGIGRRGIRRNLPQDSRGRRDGSHFRVFAPIPCAEDNRTWPRTIWKSCRLCVLRWPTRSDKSDSHCGSTPDPGSNTTAPRCGLARPISSSSNGFARIFAGTSRPRATTCWASGRRSNFTSTPAHGKTMMPPRRTAAWTPSPASPVTTRQIARINVPAEGRP